MGASTFFHPDYTVGSGLSPDLLRRSAARGLSVVDTLYRRSGITPCPEGLVIAWRINQGVATARLGGNAYDSHNNTVGCQGFVNYGSA